MPTNGVGLRTHLHSSPRRLRSGLSLWLRLRSLGLLRVERTPTATSLVVTGLRQADACAIELRAIALDAESYQSRQGGRPA